MNTEGTIYAIKNTINGKLYIGKTTMGRRRWFYHLTHLRRDRGKPNKHLQYAWNKYGETAFEWIVLERCNNETLNEREIHWVAHHQTTDRSKGYNKTSGGGVQ